MYLRLSKQNLAEFNCKDQSYFQTSMPNQTKFISIKKRCHMKLWVKYHFSSLRNSTTVVTLAFCNLDRFSSILHNKISKDQTKLLNPLFIKSWTIFLAWSQFLPVMHKVSVKLFLKKAEIRMSYNGTIAIGNHATFQGRSCRQRFFIGLTEV